MNTRTANEILDGLANGDRVVLAQAITLIESSKKEHRQLAHDVVKKCLQIERSETLRIGISGTPGVGKSTFIESFGTRLCNKGHRLAVLTVDPSSSLSGGSILGDKTRMTQLANEPNAFVRPSPSRGHLGGVTGRCWETVLLCEAAGYDRVIIETVGVGQSEVGVRAVADFFLLLQVAGGGDEIQCIKKGIIEMVDAILVTKADGANLPAARLAGEEFRQAMRMLQSFNPNWAPEVRECSAFTGKGLSEAVAMLGRFIEVMEKEDRLGNYRKTQESAWFQASVRDGIVSQIFGEERVQEQMSKYEAQIVDNQMTAFEASERLLEELKVVSDCTQN